MSAKVVAICSAPGLAGDSPTHNVERVLLATDRSSISAEEARGMFPTVEFICPEHSTPIVGFFEWPSS
jgi:hypothetical protein